MKVVQLKTRTGVAIAAKVRALLKDREKAEAEIAALLREQLDSVGEAKWLTWCATEFGWARSTAYTHLNPHQLQRDRTRAAAKRAERPDRPDIEPEDDSPEADIEVEDPANYRTSFLLRAEQATRFAVHSGPITTEIIATARAVAAAWSKLADKLEKSI